MRDATREVSGARRSEAIDRVSALGARVTDSVSGETDHLVVGEGAGQKLDEARDRAVSILDEDAFLELLDEIGADL